MGMNENAKLGKSGLAGGFHKETGRIQKDLGGQFPYAEENWIASFHRFRSSENAMLFRQPVYAKISLARSRTCSAIAGADVNPGDSIPIS